MNYGLRLLKHALRMERSILVEYKGVSGKYFKDAVKLAGERIPELMETIKKLESK